MTIEWFDGVTITVEAGLSAATGSYGVWDSSLWDSGTWGPDTVWTDISQWVQRIETSRRFSRDLMAWEAGEATIVLRNDDGRFSPTNPQSPYVIAGVTGLRPWRPVRVKVLGNPIYTGYAQAWNETYARGHASATVTVPCRDELASLARMDGFETEPVGGGEMSGLRIHRILNSAGHTGDRAVDIGRFTVQPTTLAGNVVAELKLTADSEGGALWVEPDGTVWFDHRFGLVENPGSNTVTATFGDGSNPAPIGSLLRLPGTAGATASTPDHSTFAVTDLDVRVRVAMDDWTPGGFGAVLASQWGSAGNESWLASISATGFPVVTFTTDGSTDLTRTATVATGFADGSEHWLRYTLDANNGASGHTVRFYTSEDGATWVDLGAPVTTAGTVTLFNSTAVLAVGDVLPWAGNVYEVQMRSGIDASVVAHADFALQPQGTTSFTDFTGRPWTVNGTAAIVGNSLGVQELPCLDITTTSDETRLANHVSFARAGGTAQLAVDQTSIALYGNGVPKTYRRHDLINESDGDVAGLAQLHLAAHKDAEQRVASITFTPRRTDYPVLLLHALGRRVRDLIRVVVRPKGGHTVVQDSFIAGIAHTIIDEGEWLVTFDLESAESWVNFTSSRWDVARWDETPWFY